MRYQGLPLNGIERRAIAEFLTDGRADASNSGRRRVGNDPNGGLVAARSLCTPPVRFADPAAIPSWIGWSPGIANAHFQSADQAGLTAADLPHLQLKWAFGFPDAATSWAQATVAGGRVFIGSQNGVVYSLSATQGCVAWTFTAHAGVRAAVVVDARSAYVADQSGSCTP